MPELPEVEVVRRGLESQRSESQQFVILKVEAYRPELRFPLPLASFKKAKGLSIVSFDRLAKYLLFRTAKGTWLSHLGMTGHWRFEMTQGLKLQKHDHLSFHFENGVSLIYNDPRRFGYVSWMPLDNESQNPFLSKLGMDPTKTSSESLKSLKAKFKGSDSNLHGLLLNQKIIAGIGNIYASEVLHKAGILPTRKGKSLKDQDFERILKCVIEVLEAAIHAGGSTISTFKSVDGMGSYQQNHLVYGREGLLCGHCTTVISMKTLNGRSSYFCKGCQR